MADLGNLQFSVSLKDMTDADIKKIKDKLEKAGFKINASADRKSLEKNINDILRNRTFKINVEPNKKIKKAAIEVNKSLLVNSVTSALKGKTFKANVDVVVKTASVQDAIKQAFAKAGMNYNTTASDVRAQRILEIQQRMALRAAQANNNLNRSYREASIGASQFARATVGLNNGLQSNIRFGGKLGTVLGNLASILSSTNILKDVIRIGGELENQRIALGAILQDGGKATDMFSKIQSLAVKSPFGIMDLNQYVKQLAAYSVPYNELYETMKRLADVSAGVGVDMGRIILAFGQVKAAGFLKGTELRQFTEANIPMVDKLAERFTNLTGKIVGAAEVYDMISKKKVTFEDVKAVLWDLTDEGGMFNNMQEVLSESLASKWKNLADAIDVMYGKISDGWVGDALKGVAGLLTEITKGWEYVGTAITSASVAFLTHKAAVLLGSKQIASTKNLYSSFLSDKRVEANNLRVAKTYRALTSAEQELIRTTNQLTVADVKRLARAKLLNREEALRIISIKKLDAATLAYIQRLYGISDAQVRAARSSTWMGRAMAQLGNGVRSLGAALKGLFLNPWTWAFGIITAIGELFTYWKKKQEEIEQRNNDIAESANGSAESLERELMKIKDMDISKMNTDEIKIKIEELTTVIKNEAFGWQGILDDVFAKEADGTFTNSAAEQLDMLKTKINEIAEAKKALADNNEVYSNVIGDTESGSFFGLGGSDIIDAMKALNKAVDENDKKLRGLGKHLTDVASAVNFATSDNAGISELLKGKNPIEQVEILQTYENEWAKFKAKLNEINAEASKTVELWDSSINSITSYAVGGYLNTLLWKFGKAKEAMREELTLSGEDINNLSEKGAQIVKGFVETSIKESSTQKTKMKQFYYDLWTEAFDIDWVDLGYIVPPNSFDDSSKEEYDPSKDEVAKLWKKRAEEIDKAVAAYDKWKEVEGKDKASQRIKSMSEFADLFNGKYGFNLDLENPTATYEYIQSKLNKDLEKQRELYIQLGVKLNEAELDDAKNALKIFLDKSKKYIDETTSKWNLYKDVFQKTGNKSIAMNIAFGKEIGFTNQLEHLKKDIEAIFNKIETDISFDELIKLNDIELENKGLSVLKEYVEAYRRIEKEQWKESSSRLMAFIEENMAYADRVKLIQKQSADDITSIEKQRTKDNSDYIDTLIANRKKLENQQLNSLAWSEFKKSDGYSKMFENLERMPISTIEAMIDELEKMKGSLKDLKVTEIKELISALEKLKKEIEGRNPFSLIKDSLEKLSNNSRDNESWVNLGVGVESAVKYVKELAASFTEAFELMGITANEQGKKILAGVEGLGLGIAKIVESYGKQDFVGIASGLMSSASSMAKIYSGIFSNTAEKEEEIKFLLDLIKLQTEYNSKLIETKLLNDDIWDNSKITEAVDAVEALSQAVEYYDELLNKQVAKHQDPSGGFWKRLGKWNFWNPFGWWSSAFGSIVDGGQSKELVSIKDNLRYITQKSGLFKHTKTTNLVDWLRDNGYGELFDEKGRLNLELATTIKDWDRLTDETKEYLENIIEAEEAIRNAEDALSSYISDTFGELGISLSDAIVDAFRNGKDAAQTFRDSVVDVLEDVGAQIMRNVFLSDIFTKYQGSLEDVYKKYATSKDKEQFAKDMADVTSTFFDEVQDGMEAGSEWLEMYKKIFSEKGFDVFSPDSSADKGLSKSIQGVTEDTANLLGSYLNSLRHDVSVKRSIIEKLAGEDIPKMSLIAQAQLTQLNNIASNTLRNAEAADRIYDLFNRVVDKGGNKLKI